MSYATSCWSTKTIVDMVLDHNDEILYPLLGLLKCFGSKGINSRSLSEGQIIMMTHLYNQGYIEVEELSDGRQVYKLKDPSVNPDSVYIYEDEFNEDHPTDVIN